MTKDIRQQNAERRLRNQGWGQPRPSLVSGDAKALIFGALTALVFLAIVYW